VKILGERGFQVFVDGGLEPDNDLVQLLIREVLEEEIVALISNQLLTDHQLQTATKTIIIANDSREPTVRTPQPTPPDSPVPSARQSFRPMPLQPSPRTSISFEPKIVEPVQKPSTEIKPVPEVIEYDDKDESESIFETSNDEHEEVEFIIDPKLIVLTKTPTETPRQSPTPPPMSPVVTQHQTTIPQIELKYDKLKLYSNHCKKSFSNAIQN
jgi:hypothetical protein